MKQITSLALAGAICLLLLPQSSANALDLGRIGLGRGKRKINIGKIINFGKKFARAVKPAEDLLPEQEYYVGRSVAANVLGQYRVLKDVPAHEYINKVGQALALVSDRPQTYRGYRFIILDTDEINGLSAPSGFIFITRGLLRTCRNEDELASVLAHEIAHVVHKHGLRSIKASRWTDVGTIIAGEASDRALRGNGVLRHVTKSFSGGVDDITKRWIKGKHSRATELVADRTAVEILRRAGYNPAAFLAVLERLKVAQASERRARGFAATHPQPDVRINTITPLIGTVKPVIDPPARKVRFAKALQKAIAK